jgi:hypothetical protein
LPKQYQHPLRDEEVIALARATRLVYDGWTPAEVAAREQIELHMLEREGVYLGGAAMREQIGTAPLLFPSIADEATIIRSRERAALWERIIVIFAGYKRGGERVSLEEAFWHEYFHLHWSDVLEPYDSMKHEYITHGVLHQQDEHRADLFAAGVLIDHIDRRDTPATISARCGITQWLASLALNTEHRKHLFSRDWTPRY